jgi:hypothetical protein
MTFTTASRAWHRFVRWIAATFSGHRDAEPSIVVASEPSTVHAAVLEPPPAVAPSPKPKRTQRQRRDRQSMKAILDDLDKTFANLSRDVGNIGHLYPLEPSAMTGLKRIGPLVLDPASAREADAAYEGDGVELPFPSDNALLPATFLVALNRGDDAEPGFYAPDFVFGVKQRKAPWCVARQPGQAWLFGMAWRIGGKLSWEHVFAYTLGGKVVPATALYNEPVSVAHHGSYVRRAWRTSSWNYDDRESPAKVVRVSMARALHCYTERGNKWNVAVTKGGRRATFLIDPKDTAWAFADRNVEALASDGRRKRIIHFVGEHTRVRDGKSSVVRAHIRGLRDFEWQGHHVFVTSPAHHAFSMEAFTLESEMLLPQQEDATKHLSLDQLAHRLVTLEEQGNVRRRRA